MKTIALDYDETFTADPDLWRQFISAAQARGHRVVCVTARRTPPDFSREPRMPDGVPIVCTGGQPYKKHAAKRWDNKRKPMTEVAERQAQADELANEDCEVMIFLSVPENQTGVNVKMLPRDEEPNQDSPAVILASYLNANMAQLVTEAMMAYRNYKAQEAGDQAIVTEIEPRSILTAQGDIARQSDDVKIILPN